MSSILSLSKETSWKLTGISEVIVVATLVLNIELEDEKPNMSYILFYWNVLNLTNFKVFTPVSVKVNLKLANV